MNNKYILAKFLIVSFFCCFAIIGNAQILKYGANTSGSLDFIAPFTSGTSLTRVNGATVSSIPCTDGGFSTTNFPATSTFSTTLPAIQASVTPNSGYQLNVTGISAEFRRSSTGPDSVRLAYSKDGGTTWIDQGVSTSPFNGSCGALLDTGAWALAIIDSFPSTFLVRVYGFSAGATSGDLQMENLYINGYVSSITGCTMPSGLSTSGVTSSSATINWITIPGAVSYNIQYKPVYASVWSTVSSTSSAVNLTGLICSTNYEYQVQTICSSSSMSTYTSSGHFTTSACTCPIPTGLYASSITATGAKLNWSPVIGALSYNIHYRRTGTTTWSSTSSSVDSITLSSLICGTTYEFQVQTVCSGFTDSFSSSATFTTLVCACPVPTGLYVNGITTTSDTLHWSLMTGALKYSIRYREIGTSLWSYDSSVVNKKFITGLTCGTSYEFQVQSYCSIISSSAYSSSDSFTTTACPCPCPVGLTATSITINSATLKWNKLIWAINYNIRYRKVGLTIWTSAGSTTDTTLLLTGLSCNTSYEFEVQTICGGLGTGSFSSAATFTTELCIGAGSTGRIAVYFNQPVDNSVSSGLNAVYTNNSMADTLIKYINSAHYSIDIAQYNYNQSGSFANIAAAVNSAYLAGKKVRWIYDSSQLNTGVLLLNPGIHKLTSPSGAGYGAMNNKFVIIDAESPNPNYQYVITGSADWSATQFNLSYNNMVAIQDSALALAYKQEFDLMWGDTGVVPNPTVSKFGHSKADLGWHIFSIGGKTVELYFSPADSTDSHVQAAINSANTDMYFGVYNFARDVDANSVVNRDTLGVYTAGIVDQSSISSAAYPILNSIIGTNLKTYSGTGSVVYYNKMLIVDPSNFCSDPLVVTGSYDWTNAANTMNDENILIIHDDTISNLYYQSFYSNFTSLGGTLSSITNCVVYTPQPYYNNIDDANSLTVFPNPTDNLLNIKYKITNSQTVSLSIFNIVGQEIQSFVKGENQAIGEYAYTVNIETPGVYFVKFSVGQASFIKKVVKL